MLNRRSLLTKAAAGTAGAAALIAFGGRGSASAGSVTLDKLTLAHFTPLVGQSLTMYPASGAPFAVKLAKAEAVGKAATTTVKTPISTKSSSPPASQRGGPSMSAPTVAAAPAATSARPFSLLFQGPASPNLPDRIYGIDHPQLGRLDFYVTRIGPSKQAPVYEAIFG